MPAAPPGHPSHRSWGSTLETLMRCRAVGATVVHAVVRAARRAVAAPRRAYVGRAGRDGPEAVPRVRSAQVRSPPRVSTTPKSKNRTHTRNRDGKGTRRTHHNASLVPFALDSSVAFKMPPSLTSKF